MDLDELRLTVVRRLHSAAGDGSLDHEIAMSRLRRAEQAATADELQVLLTGLNASASGLNVEPYPVPHPAAPLTADPGSSESSPMVFRSQWSTLYVQGSWRVPAYIAVDPGYGAVLLDFVDALLDSPVIDVKVRESAGWTKLVIPEGWGAQIGDLSRLWGNVGTHVPEVSRPGKPQLVVRGSIGFGYLTIRHPKPRDVRRLNKYRAGRASLNPPDPALPAGS